MYGTMGLIKVKKENQQKLVETLNAQRNPDIQGFRQAFVMFPENHEGTGILVAMFEDRDSYWKNADDPEQDKRYREFAQYFEGEPTWHDGEWIESR
jgi:hypothetical protein